LQAAYPNKFINELSVHYASRAIFQELVNKRFMFSHPHQEEGLVTDYALTGLGRSVVEQEAKTSEILQATTTDDRNQQAYAEFSEGWQAAEIARLQAELAQVTHERDALREAMESILTVFGSLPIRSAYTPQQHYLVGQAYDIARDALKGKVQASEPDHK